ncbi:hypothetical protein CsSME_00035643 [Camellia sinensis var. sinensis]
MFPRFLKWDIGALLKKVEVDRLRSLEYEREVMGSDIEMREDTVADVVECVGGDEHFVDVWKVDGVEAEQGVHVGNVGCRGATGREYHVVGSTQQSKKVEGAIQTDGVHVPRGAQGCESVGDSRLTEALGAITGLELQIKKKMKWLRY